MNRLNRLQLFIARLFHIMPFDIELALRQRFHDGLELGMKQNKIYQIEPLNVWVDESQQKHEQIRMSTYEPLAKRIDPAQLGMRSRAMTRQLRENPGILWQHHNSVLKKAQMVKIEPETVIFPAAPSHSLTAPEDDWTNGNADKTEHRKAV